MFYFLILFFVEILNNILIVFFSASENIHVSVIFQMRNNLLCCSSLTFSFIYSLSMPVVSVRSHCAVHRKPTGPQSLTQLIYSTQ